MNGKTLLGIWILGAGALTACSGAVDGRGEYIEDAPQVPDGPEAAEVDGSDVDTATKRIGDAPAQADLLENVPEPDPTITGQQLLENVRKIRSRGPVFHHAQAAFTGSSRDLYGAIAPAQ